MVDPALGVLDWAMRNKAKLPKEALTAARDVLDRAGHKAADKHEISGPDGGPIDNVLRVEFVKPE